jgi:hypothetical protein
MVAGAVVYLLSIVFNLLFIGIPPQDPSAEMQAERAALYHMQSVMEWGALVVFAAGAVWLAAVLILLRIQTNSPEQTKA